VGGDGGEQIAGVTFKQVSVTACFGLRFRALISGVGVGEEVFRWPVHFRQRGESIVTCRAAAGEGESGSGHRSFFLQGCR